MAATHWNQARWSTLKFKVIQMRKIGYLSNFEAYIPNRLVIHKLLIYWEFHNITPSQRFTENGPTKNQWCLVSVSGQKGRDGLVGIGTTVLEVTTASNQSLQNDISDCTSWPRQPPCWVSPVSLNSQRLYSVIHSMGLLQSSESRHTSTAWQVHLLASISKVCLLCFICANFMGLQNCQKLFCFIFFLESSGLREFIKWWQRKHWGEIGKDWRGWEKVSSESVWVSECVKAGLKDRQVTGGHRVVFFFAALTSLPASSL